MRLWEELWEKLRDKRGAMRHLLERVEDAVYENMDRATRHAYEFTQKHPEVYIAMPFIAGLVAGLAGKPLEYSSPGPLANSVVAAFSATGKDGIEKSTKELFLANGRWKEYVTAWLMTLSALPGYMAGAWARYMAGYG